MYRRADAGGYDGDGIDENFVDENDSNCTAIGATEPSWPGFPALPFSRSEVNFVGTPLAADIDSDGRPELITNRAAIRGTVVFAIHSDGSPVHDSRYEPDAITLIGVGDVDGDGQLEIVGLTHAIFNGAP